MRLPAALFTKFIFQNTRMSPFNLEKLEYISFRFKKIVAKLF